MCGRYRIKDTDAVTAHMRRIFGIPEWVATARYNMAPSQALPVLARNRDGEPHLATMRWGYVPFWEKSAKPKIAPINAQAESVATNAMFRQSLQKRRCLVPADGFYEWMRFDEETKVPFDIHLREGRPFFFAGIFEAAAPGQPDTFAILTTRANELMSGIHNRMPAILDPGKARRWLEPGAMEAPALAELTEPHPSAEMEAVSVSNLVNSPRNDLPECLEPVDFHPPPPKPTQGELF